MLFHKNAKIDLRNLKKKKHKPFIFWQQDVVVKSDSDRRHSRQAEMKIRK